MSEHIHQYHDLLLFEGQMAWHQYCSGAGTGRGIQRHGAHKQTPTPFNPSLAGRQEPNMAVYFELWEAGPSIMHSEVHTWDDGVNKTKEQREIDMYNHG